MELPAGKINKAIKKPHARRGCLRALREGRAATGHGAISSPVLGSSDTAEERGSSAQARARAQKENTQNAVERKKNHHFCDWGRMAFHNTAFLHPFPGAQGTPAGHTELLQHSPTRRVQGCKSFRRGATFLYWVGSSEGLHKPEPTQTHDREQHSEAQMLLCSDALCCSHCWELLFSLSHGLTGASNATGSTSTCVTTCKVLGSKWCHIHQKPCCLSHLRRSQGFFSPLLGGNHPLLKPPVLRSLVVHQKVG